MPPENNGIQKYINQVTENIRNLFDLTARIDERVKIISDKQNECDAKMERYLETHTHLVERVVGLESQNGERCANEIEKLDHELNELKSTIHHLELTLGGVKMITSSQEYRWKVVFDFIVKVGMVIASAIVIYKIGMG